MMNFPTIYAATSRDIPATANMQTAPAAVPTEGLAYEGCEIPAPKRPKPRPFKVGSIYATRSACDYDCIFRWRIVRRTAKSVAIVPVDCNGKAKGEPTLRRIGTNYEGTAEMIYPSGRYSMCPILTADKEQA